MFILLLVYIAAELDKKKTLHYMEEIIHYTKEKDE